jgi:YggT family protein
MTFLITFIDITVTVLTVLLFAYSLLSFFMSPYHPIRHTIGLVIEPLLKPIRKLIPPAGGFDFSPMVLLILLQVLGRLLTALLRSLS